MKKGDKVKWNYGKYKAHGEIKEKYTRTIEKKIKNSTIKRKANKKEPAYLIEQVDGSKVLKSESELTLIQ